MLQRTRSESDLRREALTDRVIELQFWRRKGNIANLTFYECNNFYIFLGLDSFRNTLVDLQSSFQPNLE